MELKFKNEAEFEEFMFDTFSPIVCYAKQNKDSFKLFVSCFYSVIYGEGVEDKFEFYSLQVKHLMNSKQGKEIAKLVQEAIKEIRLKSNKAQNEIKRKGKNLK